jgi:hypothetical protein
MRVNHPDEPVVTNTPQPKLAIANNLLESSTILTAISAEQWTARFSKRGRRCAHGKAMKRRTYVDYGANGGATDNR